MFNLTDRDIDFQNGRLLIRSREGTTDMLPFHVKDHEDREIPLPPHTLKLLAGWMKARPSGLPYLLLTPERYSHVLSKWHRYRDSGKQWVNDDMVDNVVRDIRSHAKRVGLQLYGALTVHRFRKSCGQKWGQPFAHERGERTEMGHADISTTSEYYSKVTEEHEVKAAWVIEALTRDVSPDKNTVELPLKAKTRQNRKAG